MTDYIADGYCPGIIQPKDGIPPAFQISHPPAPSANVQLLENLLLQASHQRETSRNCLYNIGGNGSIKGGLSGLRDVSQRDVLA